jgi:hypothetical protein
MGDGLAVQSPAKTRREVFSEGWNEAKKEKAPCTETGDEAKVSSMHLSRKSLPYILKPGLELDLLHPEGHALAVSHREPNDGPGFYLDLAPHGSLASRSLQPEGQVVTRLGDLVKDGCERRCW